MRSLVSLFAVGALVAAPAFAQLKSDQKIDNADAAAMKQLAQANLNEIEGGKMAASKAQSPEVKKFAQKMVDDHGKMLDDLKTLAQQKSVALPQSASMKDMAQMKIMERSSGADFDKKYMAEMVKDHQKDLKEVQDLAAKAKDPDFKAAVQKASGKINEHLQLAQRIANSSAAGSTSSSSSSTTTPAPGSTTSPSASGQEVNPKINYSK
jgi:putative membrane protein